MLTAHTDSLSSSELYLRIENLLDEEYQQVFGYGTPERSGFIGLRANF